MDLEILDMQRSRLTDREFDYLPNITKIAFFKSNLGDLLLDLQKINTDPNRNTIENRVEGLRWISLLSLCTLVIRVGISEF